MRQDSLLKQAFLAKERKDYDVAEKCFRDYLTIAPHNAEALRELGFIVYGIRKKYQDGRDLFIQSLQIEDCFNGHFYLAMALARLNQTAEAEREYREALVRAENKDDRGLVETEYAIFLGRNGRFDESLRYFQDALSDTPDYGRAKRFYKYLLENNSSTTQA